MGRGSGRIVVKITDVARHAGVSASTVSYALSGKRSISEETRRRVADSIEALGYRPHAGARSLAGNRSHVIALMIPLRSGIHVPVVMQFVTSVVIAARRHDHDVLLLTQEEGEEGVRRVAGGSMADAMIVMDVELHDVRLPLLRSLDRPAVLIGIPADTTGVTCIDLDFRAAAEACVDHLAGLGHRNVALVGPPPEVYERGTGYAERMVEGYRTAAARHGIPALIRPCEAAPDAARRLAGELLAEQPDLSGVVVHNEPIAAPLVDAFRRAGRDIPGDLSVVAVCPDELAEHAEPPFTSVNIPAQEVGEHAVELLMACLRGEDVPPITLVPPTLTTRASAAGRQ